MLVCKRPDPPMQRAALDTAPNTACLWPTFSTTRFHILFTTYIFHVHYRDILTVFIHILQTFKADSSSFQYCPSTVAGCSVRTGCFCTATTVFHYNTGVLLRLPVDAQLHHTAWSDSRRSPWQKAVDSHLRHLLQNWPCKLAPYRALHLTALSVT